MRFMSLHIRRQVYIFAVIGLFTGTSVIALRPQSTDATTEPAPILVTLDNHQRQLDNHEARLTNAEADVASVQQQTNTPPSSNRVPVPEATPPTIDPTADPGPTTSPGPTPPSNPDPALVITKISGPTKVADVCLSMMGSCGAPVFHYYCRYEYADGHTRSFEVSSPGDVCPVTPGV